MDRTEPQQTVGSPTHSTRAACMVSPVRAVLSAVAMVGVMRGLRAMRIALDALSSTELSTGYRTYSVSPMSMTRTALNANVPPEPRRRR